MTAQPRCQTHPLSFQPATNQEKMTMTVIVDEMPDTWVHAVVTAIKVFDHEVADCHESAIVIDLNLKAMRVLDADPGEQLIIGWTERAGVDWGLGRADHVPDPQPLNAHTPTDIATAVHLLLTTGKPA